MQPSSSPSATYLANVASGVPWAAFQGSQGPAYLPDGVVVSAKDMAVPSKTSVAQLLGYRDNTEPLSYGAVAKTHGPILRSLLGGDCSVTFD
ncbi:unnamed protein product [Heligmosomoides polygyrus]|uniref:Transpeptidase domain-containing protein n=1 Tax=Heligmosomoides polygyrus TaxID=6339 RepID=A0A183GFY5_HELPZ|nr:unnamed protein product [Heligmosomoides polygyrus]